MNQYDGCNYKTMIHLDRESKKSSHYNYWDYLDELSPNQRKDYLESIALDKMENIQSSDIDDYCVCNGEWEAYRYDDRTYFILHRGKENHYYVEAPTKIYESKRFHWRKDTKTGCKIATIESKYFRYEIICKADGNVNVSVKYCKCENRHRNVVTIAEFEVLNATNNAIHEAIKDWSKDFRKAILNTSI